MTLTGISILKSWPLVKLFNNNTSLLCIILEFIASLKTVTKVEILPYHNLGKFKWEELNVPYEFENVKVPTNDDVKKAKEILGI